MAPEATPGLFLQAAALRREQGPRRRLDASSALSGPRLRQIAEPLAPLLEIVDRAADPLEPGLMTERHAIILDRHHDRLVPVAHGRIEDFPDLPVSDRHGSPPGNRAEQLLNNSTIIVNK